MDITVKQAYDRLLAACESIDALEPANIERRGWRDDLAEDVYTFICHISNNCADERYAYFNEVYQGGAYPETAIWSGGKGTSSNLFDRLRSFSEKTLKEASVRPDNMYIAFFNELGKYYLFSKQDKKDIDPRKYMNYIQELQASVKSCGGEMAVQTKASDTKTVGERTDTTEKNTKKEGPSENSVPEEPEESLEELLDKLNALIGLAGVKSEVTSLINMLKIKKIRESRGMETANVSKHLVFLGNPGTGKTTVARLLSKIYKQLGVLEKGQLVEVDRAGLVAGYVGQTALKTKEKIDEAMGGILFIDEAYTLAKGGNDFGQEAIDTILKAMEDNRENFVVVVAGYPEPMDQFLESNPGLKSRFNKNIMFEDYSEEELFSIFEAFCRPYGMRLNGDAEDCLKKYLNWLVQNKTENFANGREMRNLFEGALSNQANRLADNSAITDEELNEIRVEDFPVYVKENQ